MTTSLVGPLSSGTAAGVAGSATANQTSTTVIRGKVRSVYIQYLDSPPATTDVTVATAGVSALPASNILVLSNANTDIVKFPRVVTHKRSDGTNVTYDGTNAVYDAQYIHDKVKVTIAQANAGDSVNVYLVIED